MKPQLVELPDEPGRVLREYKRRQWERERNEREARHRMLTVREGSNAYRW